MSSQALQSKHDALLKRVDELDTECEQLRDQLLEAEGEKDELQGVIEDLETEKGKLSADLDSKQVSYVRLHTRTHAHTFMFPRGRRLSRAYILLVRLSLSGRKACSQSKH